MNKLFGTEELETAYDNDIVIDEVSLREEIEGYQDTFEIVSEALKTASTGILNVQHIRHAIENKEVASVAYFTAIEDYRPMLSNIADNLGVKLSVPSLEDFKNTHGTKASHQIAVEGLFSYVKKLWDKMKEVFALFFKKINMFLRRLMGYELDLQTYEKYLDAGIPKLKSSKPKISNDKASLESKLPSFVAREGMETVSVEYALTETDARFKNLNSLINTIFNQNLPKLVRDDFNSLQTLINQLITTSPEVLANETIVEQLEKDIIQYCENTLTRIFEYSNLTLNDLPEKVYEDIQFNFDRNELKETSIHSLVNSNNTSAALPKNYNCFFITLPGKKITVSSSVELNTQVSNHLYPIANVDNLIRFYEQYKKYSKEINLKKVDSSLSIVEDCIEKLTNLMRNKFSDRLELLNTTTAKKEFKFNSIASAVQGFEELERKVSPDDEIIITMEINDRFDHFALYKTRTIDIAQFEHLLIEARLDKAFIQYVENSYERFITPEGLTDEDRKAFIKRLEYIQKYLINFLNNLQSTLKDLSINLVGTQSELKLEILKYAYNSMKLYNI